MSRPATAIQRSFAPDDNDNDSVANSYDDGWQDEEEEGKN